MSLPESKAPIQSTAGAIPMKNEKGELYMQKVKVSRYVTGKRPDYAPDSGQSESEDEDLIIKQSANKAVDITTEDYEEMLQVPAGNDRRLRRLMTAKSVEDRTQDNEDEDRVTRHRRLREPEVLATGSDGEDEGGSSPQQPMEEISDDDEEELDEEEIERRRLLLRQRAKQKQQEELDEEVMDVEDEKEEKQQSDDESSEYEEYTDSEDEDTGPRLKPVFVRKKDRVTIQQREEEEQKQRELEREKKKLAEERRVQARKLVEELAKKEFEEARDVLGTCEALDSGDENDEEEYEAWKVRELKRIKRDRDEREALEKDKMDVERTRNMTEEERRAEQRVNPKIVTNKSQKGKYKFLQKYFHRGAFFLDKEDDVYKRDFSNATLEDHFDKTILPKVMQVKNFGRSGRTKYTHLVDQDTTSFDSPWMGDSSTNLKLNLNKAGGMRNTFDKPTTKKRK